VSMIVVADCWQLSPCKFVKYAVIEERGEIGEKGRKKFAF